MSKGPGRIERAIETALTAEPDNALTTDELVKRAFPGVDCIEKKHRVSVLRAAKKVLERTKRFGQTGGEGYGRQAAFFHLDSLMSYAMARLKTNLGPDNRAGSDDRLRARLEPGGRSHYLVAEDGRWWLDLEMLKALRDGDAKRLAKLEARLSAKSNVVMKEALAGA